VTGRTEGPFLLRLQVLDEGANHLEMAGTAAELNLDPAFVRAQGPVVARVDAFRAGEKVEVRGQVTGEVALACDRCLTPLRRTIQAELRVYAERRETRDRRSDEEVREDDLGIVYHDGRFVDLTDEVRQVFLVEVPWHVLCREECQGLCPRCGADLNGGACGCPVEVHDHRWAELENLRVDASTESPTPAPGPSSAGATETGRSSAAKASGRKRPRRGRDSEP
jgi:uncharacterized protein